MRFKALAGAVVASVFVTVAAHAVTITATDATGATSSPFVLANFGTASTSGLVSTAPIMMSNSTITFAPNASTPQAGVYSGNTANKSLSPFTGTGLTASNYLVAEPNDPVNFAFTSAQTSFSLLWGSVDTYNSLSLTFTSGTTTTTTTITGAQVISAVGSSYKGGSAFVTISGVGPFTNAAATSTTAAFEFVPAGQVPEPASIAILGGGLAGLGMIRRRRARANA